jgi:SNF2 family DNA or RNA helicase
LEALHHLRSISLHPRPLATDEPDEKYISASARLALTSANHVIHLSRWWNPAVEDQCTDRIYRIGQDRPVQVHIPIAIHPQHREHSFDERLHALLRRKRDLSRQVLGLSPGGGTQADL